jgi:hypothetical protein
MSEELQEWNVHLSYVDGRVHSVVLNAFMLILTVALVQWMKWSLLKQWYARMRKHYVTKTHFTQAVMT